MFAHAGCGLQVGLLALDLLLDEYSHKLADAVARQKQEWRRGLDWSEEAERV
jgi:hypothetical protein